MPWPSWVFWRQKPQDEKAQDNDTPSSSSSPLLPKEELPPSSKTPWSDNLNRRDWTQYTTPQTLVISGITTLTTLALIRLYKTHLRRIPTTQHLKPDTYRKHSLYGYVTRVGDGDNFHLFHTPGGRWLGWGWFPGRRVQGMGGKEVRGRTVKVRIAGVDAPEGAHFGKQPQPYAKEALDWLQGYILHRYVRVYPLRQDQYERAVAAVYSRRWVFFRSDVGLEMIKRGWATVYEAKVFAEFNGKEEEYRSAEERAKENGIGMWQQPGLVGRLLGKKKTVETPRQYKTRTAKEEKEHG